ncbi:MAG TPA: sugar transferase [Anaerolineales bacterium]
MFRRFSINFALFSMSLDALLVAAALVAANAIRPDLNSLPFTSPVPGPLQLPWLLYLLFPAAWVAILLLLSVYDGRRNLKIADELTTLTLGSALATVSLAGTLYLSYREISRALFLTFIVLSYLFLIGWRLLARVGYRLSYTNPGAQRRVLIVGAGPVGMKMQEQIQENPFLGLTVAGYLDDNRAKRSTNPEILGCLEDARKVINSIGVDDVVIALPQRAHERVNRLVAEVHNLPVRVWVIPDYFHLALHKAVIEEFAGIPMLDLRAPALNEYQRLVKRAFDLTVTLLFMLPALPLMGIIALAIRQESEGPILFRQPRVGENGRLFEMLKFRTMVPEAEQLRHLVEKVDEQGNFIHKTSNDPRVTRVGRFLRKTSLDELPQLFNILKGNMSMVGPRPELPYLVDQYEPWQRKRFAVPQGLTGWWQVNGRSDKPMHLNTEDDLYYVQNYSLLLDIQILLKTIVVVVRGKGAY